MESASAALHPGPIASARAALFDYFDENHGLALTESEIDDIERAVRCDYVPPPIQRDPAPHDWTKGDWGYTK